MEDEEREQLLKRGREICQESEAGIWGKLRTLYRELGVDEGRGYSLIENGRRISHIVIGDATYKFINSNWEKQKLNSV